MNLTSFFVFSVPLEDPEDHSTPPPPPPNDSPGLKIPGMPPSLKPPRSWELIQSGLAGPVSCLRPQSLSLANSPWDTPVGTPGEAPNGFMSLTRPNRSDRKKQRPTSLPVTLGEALARALPPKEEEKKEKEMESSDWDSEEEFEDEEDLKEDEVVDDGATLGREGTMQGREEIWQANETVEKSTDDDDDDDEEEEEDEDDEDSNNEEEQLLITKDETDPEIDEQREEKSEDSEVEEKVVKKREGRAILPEFPTPIKVPNVQFTAREISLEEPPAAPPRKKKHRKPLDDSDAEDGYTKAAYAPLKRRLRAVVSDR
jgi:hypothetical protein